MYIIYNFCRDEVISLLHQYPYWSPEVTYLFFRTNRERYPSLRQIKRYYKAMGLTRPVGRPIRKYDVDILDGKGKYSDKPESKGKHHRKHHHKYYRKIEGKYKWI